MSIANNSEHQINWNVKLAANRGEYGGQSALKSIGNMLFMRGDGVYEKQYAMLDEEVLGESVSGLYTS